MLTQKSYDKSAPVSLVHDDRGLATVEYVILLVLVAVIAVVGWKDLGSKVVERLNGANSVMQTVPVPSAGG